MADMGKIQYPTPSEIIELNKILLKEIKVKKADKPELLSYKALTKCIEACQSLEGDMYDKATCLLKNLVQKHPFASGNRRTAFAATERFLSNNGAKLNITDAKFHVQTFKGIREGYYSDEEIKNWLKTGEIREFKR